MSAGLKPFNETVLSSHHLSLPFNSKLDLPTDQKQQQQL
jgi:hypothetical protein